MTEDIEVNEKGLVAVINKSNNVYRNILQKGVDYDKPYPSAPKPVLLKPGMEKLLLAFNLELRILNIDTQQDGADREYTITTGIFSRKTGEKLAEGIGMCSTKEKKWTRDNPPDQYNTILKMAKKRSGMDATLSGLGLSALFTQDLIEKKSEIDD